MSIKEHSLVDFVKLPSSVQNDSWYDWFCKDRSLPAKTVKLVKLLKQVMRANGLGARFDPRTSYVFFKNNCPGYGTLYDDFRICDMATGDVLFCIVPRSGHKCDAGQASVWGKPNDFKEALLEGKWSDVIAYFEGNKLGTIAANKEEGVA